MWHCVKHTGVRTRPNIPNISGALMCMKNIDFVYDQNKWARLFKHIKRSNISHSFLPSCKVSYRAGFLAQIPKTCQSSRVKRYLNVRVAQFLSKISVKPHSKVLSTLLEHHSWECHADFPMHQTQVIWDCRSYDNKLPGNTCNQSQKQDWECSNKIF